jgi:phosphoribosylformylglycinamidine synthase
MLWEVDILPREGQPDLVARRLAADAEEMGLASGLTAASASGYLIAGPLSAEDVTAIAERLLCDQVVERAVVGVVGDSRLCEAPPGTSRLVHVLPKPGVMDPVAQSTLEAIRSLGYQADAVRTVKKYWLGPLTDPAVRVLATRLMANEAVEQIVEGPLKLDRLEVGSEYRFRRVEVELGALDEQGLLDLSRRGQLYLTLAEMQAIQAHFQALKRSPTDVELETLAQTWSEHCSHKTLRGRIRYRDDSGERQFENLLKETVFAATGEIRRTMGARDWCVSVFADNAGVVRFDEQFHLAFKVETHNHPSAIEPYGGANTGLGGVIRDPLGTGLGARPVANTDVFCFAPPNTPADRLPPGVLDPRRVLKGVVAGVRDYGNRMGIPTVNGAIVFDERYLANPLVFCGTVGLLPVGKVEKRACPGDLIVAIGGRTGRDGIHGATFSSGELTSESESVSGGAVQIGNAITEKMMLDVVLAARDRGLFSAITDCGAGGFSSAVGEMGADLGAEVWLDRVPLKYEGLSYTEIWISEAQERMVLAVPPDKRSALLALAHAEGVEATVIGRFEATGRLRLMYQEREVADLSMHFLHDGRPSIVREAVWRAGPRAEYQWPVDVPADFTRDLHLILGSLSVASKEWVIRQYDHEVQGGSVIKPLVGAANDGPSDAAVFRPVLESRRGVVLACGINPRYVDLDPYAMAASAIDEAVRNCVSVGADPSRIAILDNFCWPDTSRPENLGTLVRTALACHDVAIGFGTPFISGKDSLNNEFHYTRRDGTKGILAIPPTLLISAMGQVEDVERCVSMDLKQAGNMLYAVGMTRNELGGSHLALVTGSDGGLVPAVDVELARRTFQAVHRAIHAGHVRACHDPSEGGWAVAAAEMAFAGGLGADLDASRFPRNFEPGTADEMAIRKAEAAMLFSESNSRFLCEVSKNRESAFEALLEGIPHARVGRVTSDGRLIIRGLRRAAGDTPPTLVAALASDLKESWQAPLRW